MFNKKPYNVGQLNGIMGFGLGSSESISFDGFGLQNATYCIQYADWDGIASIEINDYNNPQYNGGGILSKYYRDKIINMRGSITGDDADDLKDKIDNIKGKLARTEGYLQVKFGDDFRRIKATVSDINIPRNHYNVNYITFTISFLCKEPFFEEIPMQEKVLLSKTTSFNDEIDYTAYGETYTYTNIVFNSATSVTSITMDIEGKSIVISETINAGDVIVIDGFTKKVLINGIEKDYLGVFQYLNNGKNIVTFTINGTRNIDISILYKNLYK